MNILILGGGGFIGGHLAKRLHEEGNKVVCVDIKEPEYWKQEDICDQFIKDDLRIPQFVDALMQGYYGDPWDEVYQLAADMGGAGYIFTGENDANVMHNSATINLNVAQSASTYGVGRVFYSSSACMYPAYNQGDPNNPNCKEDSAYPAAPDSEYGWEKLFSERLYKAFERNCNLPVRIARFHNIFGPCFDDQTEVLTLNGWKFFKDVTMVDYIASLSENGEMVYQQPVEKQGYQYDGDMYKVLGKSVDQLVTPDHKMYISSLTTKRGKTEQTLFSLRQAKDIKWNSNKIFFTSEFEWNPDNQYETEYTLQECRMKDNRQLHQSKSVDMGDWFEFIGWYIAEGSRFRTPTNYTVCITQYERVNKEKRDKIKNLLNRMEITYSEDNKKTQIIINSKQIYETLENEGVGIGANNKQVPSWMLQYKKEYLQRMYDAMMAGDGDKDGTRYTTTSKILKDQFMEVALKLGKTVTCNDSEKRLKDTHTTIYRISITDRGQFCTKRSNRSIVQYSGMVYDVTLPKYHTLLVRRNGKVCWSGNCGTWKGGKEKAPAAICRKVAEAVYIEGAYPGYMQIADSDPVSVNRIDIWGDGTQTRSFLYIDECVEGIIRLMRSECTEVVNIGSEEMISINDLAKMVIDISGKNLTINNIEGPTGVKGRNSHNDLIYKEIGWKPTQSLRIGMEKLYSWIDQQVNGK